MPAASGEDIRSKKWLVDQPLGRELPGGEQTCGGTHAESEAREKSPDHGR